MILTGQQIKKDILKGNITIIPFREEAVQPNSYDYHLGEELLVYDSAEIDGKGILTKTVRKVIIPKEGFTLKRDTLYLGITEEATASPKYAQLLFGDHSLGSLGVWTQITAPLAHVGSKIRWTLEIRCKKDVIVYPGMKFGKICFLTNNGKIFGYGHSSFVESGRYAKDEITHSLIDQD